MLSLDSVYYHTAEIQSLDPLGFDENVPKIQQANADKNTQFLVHTLKSQYATISQTEIGTKAVALAAMRDIGIVLGSLKRHGIEPLVAGYE